MPTGATVTVHGPGRHTMTQRMDLDRLAVDVPKAQAEVIQLRMIQAPQAPGI